MKTFIFFALLLVSLASCGRTEQCFAVSCKQGVCDTLYMTIPLMVGEVDKVWQSDLNPSQLMWFADHADWSTAGFTCKKKVGRYERR